MFYYIVLVPSENGSTVKGKNLLPFQKGLSVLLEQTHFRADQL